MTTDVDDMACSSFPSGIPPNGVRQTHWMPSAIRSNVPGSFPESVLRRRHPAIIDQVLAGHPYPPGIQRALEDLRQEITADRIRSEERRVGKECRARLGPQHYKRWLVNEVELETHVCSDARGRL